MKLNKMGCLPKRAEMKSLLYLWCMTFREENNPQDTGGSSSSGIKKIEGNTPVLEQRGNYLPVTEKMFLLLLPL